jgi:hypothetical protein
MSKQPPTPGGPEASHQNEDHIDFSKVIAVGAVSLVIFALASWWAWSILHRESATLRSRGEPRIAAQAGRPEIGIVDQVPFDSDKRLPRWQKERREWLNGYGWVDRRNGIIHVPIERAIDELVAGAVPAPPPLPAPPRPPEGIR